MLAFEELENRYLTSYHNEFLSLCSFHRCDGQENCFDEFKGFEMRVFCGIELYHSTLKNNELSL